jgi:aminoglycoside phosphotransferase (APT) family kinase protein
VVLKRCYPGSAELEAAVHGEVLPRLAVRAPRLFGVWHDGHTAWLALEDMGDEPPRLDDERQRAMVSRWLAELHVASRELAAASPLPDRGTHHYARLLESARECLVERLDEAPRGDEQRLARAIRLCDSLRSRWDAVERGAAQLPPAFVHADIAPENLRIVRSAGGLEVTAIDWEKSGTGTPFADLAIADPAAYAPAVGASLETVSSSMWVARLLAALSHRWAAKPIAEVERYADRLERALGSIRDL